MTGSLGHDVAKLDQATIEGGWESIGMDKFRLASSIVALQRLYPELPCTREAVDALMVTGRFHLLGVRWPNGLREVIAWHGDYEYPPAECVQEAYARAWKSWEHFRDCPDDFAARLELFDMEVGGHA